MTSVEKISLCSYLQTTENEIVEMNEIFQNFQGVEKGSDIYEYSENVCLELLKKWLSRYNSANPESFDFEGKETLFLYASLNALKVQFTNSSDAAYVVESLNSLLDDISKKIINAKCTTGKQSSTKPFDRVVAKESRRGGKRKSNRRKSKRRNRRRYN